MKTTIFKSIMALAMFLFVSHVPALCATEYGISVGGIAVTSDNCNNITGSTISGTVKYSIYYKRLTLKDATINCSSNYGIKIFADHDGVEIYVEGTCTLVGTTALQIEGDATVTGSSSATLNANGRYQAVYVASNKMLTINNITVKATVTEANSGTYGCFRGAYGKSKLKFQSANITITNNDGLPCVKDFASCEMVDDEVSSPLKTYFQSSLKGFGTTAGSLATGSLVIKKPTTYYGVYFAGHQFNNLNFWNFYYDNITSGSIWYSLDGFVLEDVVADCGGTNPAIYIDENAELTDGRVSIVLRGTNKLINHNGIGIYTCKDLEIKGPNSPTLNIPDGRLMMVNTSYGSTSTTALDILVSSPCTLNLKNIAGEKTLCDNKSAYNYAFNTLRFEALSTLHLYGDDSGTLRNLWVLNLGADYGEQEMTWTTPNGTTPESLLNLTNEFVYYRTSPLVGGNIITGEMVYEPATTYKTRVCAVDVTSVNCNNILQGLGVSGKASFNPQSNVLTLDNISLGSSSYEVAPFYLGTGIPNTTIKIKGDNNFTACSETAITNAEVTYFNGSEGTLTLGSGIAAYGDVVFNESTIKATALYCNSNSDHQAYFDHSDIQLSGTSNTVGFTLCGFSSIDGPDMVILSPANATYEYWANTWDNYYLTVNRQRWDGPVHIGFYEGEPTAVDGILDNQPQVEAIYDTAGRQVNSTRRGLSLMRMSDGTVRKQVRR